MGSARDHAQSFASEPYDPVDRIVTALASAGWTLSYSRDSALQVPAVLRGRNLICSIATLPLTQYGPSNARERSGLLDQIDPQVPNVITVAMLAEDLLFDGIGWLRVTTRGWNDFPSSAQHVDTSRVSLVPPDGAPGLNTMPSGVDPSGAVWVDGQPVPGRDMIRFDSPNPPLLSSARRAIQRAVKLELAAELYAGNPRPLDYFTPSGDADPAEDADITDILTEWQQARQAGTTAYVPASLTYNTVQVMSPADLQLVALQARASLDIANAIGLDPEDLGINTTSRTYQNATDRRQDRINDVLAPYMRAITDRLSMNDVTRRGYRVAFDLDDYLKADPLTRANQAQTLAGLKAITRDEIRDREGMAPLSPAQRRELDKVPAPSVPTAPQGGTPVPQQNTAPLRLALSGPSGVTLDFPDGGTTTFAADKTRRKVTGTLIPFGPVGTNRDGRWRFSTGSVEWNRSAVSRVKLNRDHDRAALLGAATDVGETDSGVTASFKVARGLPGDQALELAEDGALDGLSAEVDILDYTTDPVDPSVFLVTKARLTGAALTATPAFDDARLTSVAASTHSGKDHVMDPDATTEPQAPAAPAGAPATQSFTLDDVRAAVRAELSGSERPAVVNPNRSATQTMQVREPLPYRFDRGGNFTTGENLFSADLLNCQRSGDFDLARASTDAGRRVAALFGTAFTNSTVSAGDVNELNPTTNRPDMWVDTPDYKYPIWAAINRGAPPNGVQPFAFPKFNTASGLVGAHTEGTEPAPGSYTTTSQTVTPTAISGKASITREVWDMGGNPAVSTLIWNKMRQSWNEGLESAAATFLNTLTAATDITLTTASANDVLAGLWDAALAELQFARGYDFSAFFVEKVLYKQFVDAVDGSKRKLFPIIGPVNTNGTASARFRQLDLSGVIASPAWSLASTAGSPNNSWLFDPSVVWGWATAPTRLEFSGTAADGSYAPVAMVDLAVWGYKALANTDIAGVRQVIYDSAA